MKNPAHLPVHIHRCGGWLAWLGVAALGLAGCGGGVYYEDGYDGGYGPNIDSPPTVSLVANTDVSAPGAALRLVAAASDDYAVRSVEFFIRDARGDLPLVRLQSPPWEITTTVPVNAVGLVTYVARAVDDVGQESRPAIVDIRLQGY